MPPRCLRQLPAQPDSWYGRAVPTHHVDGQMTIEEVLLQRRLIQLTESQNLLRAVIDSLEEDRQHTVRDLNALRATRLG